VALTPAALPALATKLRELTDTVSSELLAGATGSGNAVHVTMFLHLRCALWSWHHLLGPVPPTTVSHAASVRCHFYSSAIVILADIPLCYPGSDLFRYSGTDAALMIPLRGAGDTSVSDCTLDAALASAKEAFSLRYRTEFGFDLADRWVLWLADWGNARLLCVCDARPVRPCHVTHTTGGEVFDLV
jgi:hypothetical protein